MKKYNLDDYEPFTANDGDVFLNKKVVYEKMNGNEHMFVNTIVTGYTDTHVLFLTRDADSFEDSISRVKFDDGSPFGKLRKKKSNLEIAKEKYKEGMKVKSPSNGTVYTIKGYVKEAYENNIDCDICTLYYNYNGKWAEILPLLTTEDGVDVFDPEKKVWSLNCADKKTACSMPATLASKIDNKIFSTKEACEKYVNSQEKDLSWFESRLLSSKGNADCFEEFDLELMKSNLPWIYWQLVLKEILDYYSGNDERKSSIEYQEDYKKYNVYKYNTIVECPYRLLGTQEACQKAIKLMGENLDCIYKK